MDDGNYGCSCDDNCEGPQRKFWGKLRECWGGNYGCSCEDIVKVPKRKVFLQLSVDIVEGSRIY
ncbi:9555_t:CDS:2 [Funneliformis geosporum]|uniref:9555_t:CDS:1 n=1 Tax=Funneliformis geosporum TaxID=1117311 RepID=A0A9W4SFT9_9GLOM|nr:9555_t:CDS:2 [Funneliformis geosporum]